MRTHFAVRQSPANTTKREKVDSITIKQASRPHKLRLMDNDEVEKLRQKRKRRKTKSANSEGVSNSADSEGVKDSEGVTDPKTMDLDLDPKHTDPSPNTTDQPINEETTAQNKSTDHRHSRSGRIIKPKKRLIEAMVVEETNETEKPTLERIENELFAYLAIPEQEDMIAHKATTDPDTMYWHQAMKEPDKDQFIKASIKEVNDQMDNGIFSIVPATEVPKGVKPLPAVWQMKRKRDIRSRKVKKWKARLNIDGSRMSPDQYDLTYAPVASWNSIRLLLALTTLHKWHTIQIDYVLAFPQAPVERELYMKIPVGFEVPGANPNDFVLKIHRNIYGQKQARKVWNSFLVNKLKGLGFKQSATDECVLYKGNVMYVLYTDDSILAGPDRAELEKVIEEISNS